MAQQKKDSNVSVGVRIRPMSEKDVAAGMQTFFNKSPDGASVEELDENGAVAKHWPYDYVFGNDSTNEEIFHAAASKLVDSALEGYNTVIFLYGQTASGKTFTLFGNQHTTGVVQQAIDYVYAKVKASIDMEYVIKLNYAELYNEEIQDLLSPTPNKNLKIIEDPHVGPMIQNITEPVFTTEAEVKVMLEEGENRRHFGVTNMNVHSSRSHVIVRLLIESRRVQMRSSQPLRPSWGKDRPNCVSTLNLVDLAGSERANKAGTSGETFKEGSYINRSLLTLGTVIANLSDGKTSTQHIPYRNSKLTRLLATALGGNAKTCMLTCISPASGNLAESLNTLRFATRAKRIVNHVQKNEILDMKSLNNRLTIQAAEIEHLRQQLDQSRQLGFNPSDEDQGETLREKAVWASKKWRSLQFMLLYGARIISGLRGMGMSHLAKSCLVMMRQAVSGQRDTREVVDEFSTIISTYLSKDRFLLEKMHDLELQNESEVLLGVDDAPVQMSYEFEEMMQQQDHGDVFHMLERGGDDIHEQLEASLFACEDLRCVALKGQARLRMEIQEGLGREKQARKQVEDLQSSVIELRETIRSLRNAETALQKQNEELKSKAKLEASAHAEQLKQLTDRLAQHELTAGDKDAHLAAKNAELMAKDGENEKLKAQVTQLAQDLQVAIQAKKAFEEETSRIRNEERIQMDRLRSNMHQMMVKGGEESKVIERHNAELQKQIDTYKDQLEEVTRMKDAFHLESVTLRATVNLSRKEEKARHDEISAQRDENGVLAMKFRDARLEITKLTTNLSFTEQQIAQLYHRLEMQEKEAEEATIARNEQLWAMKQRYEARISELQSELSIKDAELESERAELEAKQMFVAKIEQSLNADISRLEKKLAAQTKLCEQLQTENTNSAMQLHHAHHKHLDEIRALKHKINELQGIIDSVNDYIAKQEQEDLFVNTSEDSLLAGGSSHAPLALSDAYFADDGSVTSFYDSPYSRRGSYMVSRKSSFITGERQQETLYYKSHRRHSSQSSGANSVGKDSVLDDMDFTAVASDSGDMDDDNPPSNSIKDHGNSRSGGSGNAEGNAMLSPLTPPFQPTPFLSPSTATLNRKNTRAKNVAFSEPNAATAEATMTTSATSTLQAEEEFAIYQQKYQQIIYSLNLATILMEHNIAEDRLQRQTMMAAHDQQIQRLQEGGYQHQQQLDQEEFLLANREQLQQSLQFSEKKLEQVTKRLSALEKEYEALNKDYHRAIGTEKVAHARADNAEIQSKDLKLRLEKAKLDLQRMEQEFTEMKLSNLRLQGKIEEGEEEQKALLTRLEISKREVDILGVERDEMMKRYLPQLANRRPTS